MSEQRDIRLIAIDLDGTLLRSDHTISHATIDAIQTLAQRIPIIIATARPPRSSRAFHSLLALTTPSIHYNGALVWNMIDSTLIEHRPINAGVSQRLISAARSIHPDVIVNIERMDRWFTDRIDEKFFTATARSFVPDVVAHLDSFCSEPSTKLMFHAEPSSIDLLHNSLTTQFANEVVCIRTDPDLLQFIHISAGKWPALRAIFGNLGIKNDHVLSIGDNENDIEMIHESGVGVAMGNASLTVKQSADLVAPTNDEDGVLWTLRRFFPDELR